MQPSIIQVIRPSFSRLFTYLDFIMPLHLAHLIIILKCVRHVNLILNKCSKYSCMCMCAFETLLTYGLQISGLPLAALPSKADSKEPAGCQEGGKREPTKYLKCLTDHLVLNSLGLVTDGTDQRNYIFSRHRRFLVCLWKIRSLLQFSTESYRNDSICLGNYNFMSQVCQWKSQKASNNPTPMCRRESKFRNEQNYPDLTWNSLFVKLVNNVCQCILLVRSKSNNFTKRMEWVYFYFYFY